MFVWRFDPPEEAERGCNTLTVVPNPNVVTLPAGAVGAVTDEDDNDDDDDDDDDEDDDEWTCSSWFSLLASPVETAAKGTG